MKSDLLKDDYLVLVHDDSLDPHDRYLKRDARGVYHLISFHLTIDRIVIPDGVDAIEHLENIGWKNNGAQWSWLKCDREVSFEEAARFCIKTLLPEEFHARFLGEQKSPPNPSRGGA